MEEYVVAYSIEGEEAVAVMNGNEIAHLVGFSDCYNLDYCNVWKPIEGGHLIACELIDMMELPLNRLCIRELAVPYTVHMYEWPEH